MPGCLLLGLVTVLGDRGADVLITGVFCPMELMVTPIIHI